MANYYDIGTKTVYAKSKDSIVIRHFEDGIKGGKVLDVTDFPDEFIQCGHVIIKDTTTGEYKPMPLSGTAYGSLPANHVYVGINMTTVPKAEPMTAILTAGEVNDNALPYAITSIKSAFLTACPTIRFDHD